MTYTSEVLADSPVAYWRLRETGAATTAIDEIGNLNGTYVGSPNLDVSGPLASGGTGMDFDKTDNQVNIGDMSSYSPVGLELWFYLRSDLSAAVGWPTFGMMLTPDSTIHDYFAFGSITARQENEVISFHNGQDGSWYAWNDAAATVVAGWHHVVYQINSGAWEIWLDGDHKSSDAFGTYGNYSWDALRLGCRSTGSDFFDGRMGEVAVYDTALSATRIAAHYDAGTTVPPATVTGTPADASSASDAGVTAGSLTFAGVLASAASSTLAAVVAATLVVSGTPADATSATDAAAATATSQTSGTPADAASATSATVTTATIQTSGTPAEATSATDATTATATPSNDMTYTSEVLADSPVAYWRLGEASGTTAVDETGSHNGTYVGSPTLGATGLLAGDTDTSVTFNGTSQYVDIPAAGAFTVGQPFTLEALVEVAADSTDRGIIGNGYSNTGYHLRILANNRLRMILFQDGTAYTFSDSTTVLSAGVHHLVGTWDGAGVPKVYVDGVDVSGARVAAGTIASIASGYNLRVGHLPGAPGGWNRRLDEAAIYDRALTATEVQAHYDVGTTAPIIEGTPADASSSSDAEVTAGSVTVTSVLASAISSTLAAVVAATLVISGTPTEAASATDAAPTSEDFSTATPPERTHTITAESRLTTIAAENRTTGALP